MDLIVFSKSELPVAIAALNAVAVDPHHLSTAETTFLETLVTLHGVSLEMADRHTQPIKPVAHRLTSPHSRRRLVQLAIAFTMLSRTITDGQMERLEGLARSLAIPEPRLPILRQMRQGRLRLARILLLRQLMGRFLVTSHRNKAGLLRMRGKSVE